MMHALSRPGLAGLALWLLAVAGAPAVMGGEAPLSFTLTEREASRAYYRSIYSVSEGVPSAWTGNLSGTPGGPATGAPGDTSAAFKEAVRLRINWFRAMAGVPAVIAFNGTFSTKAQQAALMMSANNQLNHFPPDTWQLYTAAGAEAAQNSNIAIGSQGYDSATAYIWDYGSSNAVVGHRRWLLYPQSTTMGTGDIPAQGSGTGIGAGNFSAANAIWVIDTGTYFNPRPTTRETFVAWPPPGYVPYNVVFPRWSFSYPNANLSAATVTMTRDGSPVSVSQSAVTNGFGENTLVWVPEGLNPNVTTTPANPGADTVYNVQISNVVIGGSPQTFNYTVTVFDPAVAGPGETTANISGPANLTANVAANFSASVPSFAPAAQWRALTLAAVGNTSWNGSALDGITAVTTGNYSVLEGGRYHLAHPTTATQSLTLPGVYLAPAGGNASLQFLSALGFATATQTARAQISLDGGLAWTDLYTQSGNSSAGETTLQSRNVSLAAFAGRTFQIRFIYTFGGGSFFNQTTSNVGWLLDNITLAGVQLATPGSTTLETGSAFSVTPDAAGTLRLQARGMMFNLYGLDWGPVAAFTVDEPPPPSPRDLWRAAHFSAGQLADSGVSGDDADPDLDGMTNILEYALDTDPLINSSALMPQAQLVSGQLRLAYAELRSDLIYTVQVSHDLAAWTTTGVTVAPDGGGFIASYDLDDAPAGRAFLRLLVTEAP